MLRTLTILLFLTLLSHKGFSQYYDDSTTYKLTTQYTAAINYVDAAINSIAALNSLIKKKVTFLLNIGCPLLFLSFSCSIDYWKSVVKLTWQMYWIWAV